MAALPLPVVLSIPHGGMAIPEEVSPIVCLSAAELFDDSDGFTREIYHLGSRVQGEIAADVARAFVDLNRVVDDLPPANPDGVVKRLTCHGLPIYVRPLDPPLIAALLKKYYEPYHRRLRAMIRQRGVKLLLDCHSMTDIGPSISPDGGKKRPGICLGDNHGRSADPLLTRRLADSLRRSFSLAEEEVRINTPFSGGHITRTYGYNPLPVIQVEINRALYLSPPWFDHNRREMISTDRLQMLNQRFEDGLKSFFNESRL